MLTSVLRLASSTLRLTGEEEPARTNKVVLHERRAAPRHEARIHGTICIMGREHSCVIDNLSTRGMTITCAKADPCVGVQLLVSCEGMPALSGTIRWLRGDTFGVELLKPLSLDQVFDLRQAVPPGMRSRAGRARVRLPAVARLTGQPREVEVLNLSVGGLLMRSGALPTNQCLAIEFRDMRPLGGHVRWSRAGFCGVMFSKLLPVAAAEELSCRAHLADDWLNELRGVHATALAA